MNNHNLLKTSKDLFQKLLNDYKEYQKDTLSAYKALDCALVAWHLTDWVFKEYEKEKYTRLFPKMDENNRLGEMRKEFYKSCGDLKLMHDLANGTKHFALSNPKSNMEGSHTHEGAYSDAYGSAYDISGLKIDFKDGDPKYLLTMLEAVVKFWENYFNEKARL